MGSSTISTRNQGHAVERSCLFLLVEQWPWWPPAGRGFSCGAKTHHFLKWFANPKTRPSCPSNRNSLNLEFSEEKLNLYSFTRIQTSPPRWTPPAPLAAKGSYRFHGRQRFWSTEVTAGVCAHGHLFDPPHQLFNDSDADAHENSSLCSSKTENIFWEPECSPKKQLYGHCVWCNTHLCFASQSVGSIRSCDGRWRSARCPRRRRQRTMNSGVKSSTGDYRHSMITH